ncbi:TIR domain-containing protein [Streptomyces sp. TLI_146]|uniref:TIR domain-containing protein n=1 Tax=Streptomyces sp. TLI_146 TaxID=1938858 RepID=UPI000C7046BB|nr:TIR domain-containing protein [Streptomyces sp. TLI_146]PKV89187.1 TIR domain-containing protein [Streptomyces sp. TLI_146]
MARPRIFLSHSSQCTPESGCDCRAYLLALEAHLVDLGCEPVVDKGVLNGGDTWYGKVLTEIKKCHGMIILLSPHALGSYYVMVEAIVADAERAGTDDAFVVLPVTLPGVRRRQLPDSGLGKLNLGRFDMVDWRRQDGPARPPEKIATSLRPLIERQGALPYPEVTDFLAGRISDLSDAALEHTAEILGVATFAYARGHSRYAVAQGLLTERPVENVGDSCAMRKAVKHFLPKVRSREHRQEIVDLVVPFARVPKKAAEQLRVVGESAGERVALLGSTLKETPDMYVRRASETPKPWLMSKPAPRHDGADFVESVIAEVRACVVASIGYGFECDDDTLRRLLARHEEESGPFTVVLYQPPDADLLDRLLAVFPRLLFVFAHQQAPTAPGRNGSVRLAGLTPGQEQDMVITHGEFQELAATRERPAVSPD